MIVLIILSGFVVSQLPSWAADGLLRPARRHVRMGAPVGCDGRTFAGAGVTLRGWYCHADGHTRGTIVYLHGIADNRTSATGIAALRPLDLDDLRAHRREIARCGRPGR